MDRKITTRGAIQHHLSFQNPQNSTPTFPNPKSQLHSNIPQLNRISFIANFIVTIVSLNLSKPLLPFIKV